MRSVFLAFGPVLTRAVRGAAWVGGGVFVRGGGSHGGRSHGAGQYRLVIGADGHVSAGVQYEGQRGGEHARVVHGRGVSEDAGGSGSPRGAALRPWGPGAGSLT